MSPQQRQHRLTMMHSTTVGDQLIEAAGLVPKACRGVSRREGAVHSPEEDRKYNREVYFKVRRHPRKAIIIISKNKIRPGNPLNHHALFDFQ